MAPKKKKKVNAEKPKAPTKDIDPVVQSHNHQINVLIERHKAEIKRLEASIDE